jgi:hypothetical protein
MNIPEAISKFRRAAIEKGDSSQPESRDQALHSEMADAWRFLKQSDGGRIAFGALLSDDSMHVRGWVAAQLLAMGEQSGVLEVLEANAATDGLAGFSARVVLREWRAGRLQAPL